MTTLGGLESDNRLLLETLHRRTVGPFTVDEAGEILELSRRRTQRFLAYLASRGWLARIRRGLYTTVPLGAAEPGDWRADPWLVAASTFAPCYVGGWTALEHWHLTDQLFRDVVVVTSQKVPKRDRLIQGVGYRLRHRPEELLFGTEPVWRDGRKVEVSNPERTLIDVLDDPSLGAGIRHIAECITTHFDGTPDGQRLIDYADRLGNRTVFKRLGYILETLRPVEKELIARCKDRISKGLSPLDPAVDHPGTIRKRWNLRVNVALGK